MDKVKVKYHDKIIEGNWNGKIYFADDKNYRKTYVNNEEITFPSELYDTINTVFSRSAIDFNMFENIDYSRISTVDLDFYIYRDKDNEKNKKNLNLLSNILKNN